MRESHGLIYVTSSDIIMYDFEFTEFIFAFEDQREVGINRQFFLSDLSLCNDYDWIWVNLYSS